MISKLLQLAVALLCLGAAYAVLRDNGIPTGAQYTSKTGAILAPVVGAQAPSFTLMALRQSNAPARRMNGAYDSEKHDAFTLRPAPGATIINFWATWCQPCRAEMTQLQALAASQPGAPRVIAINLGESAAAVENWVEQLGLTYTVLLDPQLAVAALYGLRGLPTTYLLDARLKVQQVYFGPVSAATLLRRIAGFSAGP